MKPIELARWKPSANDPKKMEYDGQRAAQEVFEELRDRLKDVGYLPDEYFLLDPEWEDGREIPKGADVFCTTDYGDSEGVYLDVYLKWHKEDGSPVTKSFITGKTLGESGVDLDKMFLISSAITKAFHGDGSEYTQYLKLKDPELNTGAIVHLSREEQLVLVKALTAQREQLVEDTMQAEQLLRRMTGGILQYINAVGCRPLRISTYDKVVLSVHDGDLNTFQENYQFALDQAGPLLLEAAGRPGEVGRRMTVYLLGEDKKFSEQEYFAACKRAVETGDAGRVLLMAEQAKSHVEDLSESFYGEVLTYAYQSNKDMACLLRQRATPEQISAAPPRLFHQAALAQDYTTMSDLAEKGINIDSWAGQIFHTLIASKNDWMLAHFLDQGMRLSPQNHEALHACVQQDCAGLGKKLLDRGMDFEKYQSWAASRQHDGHTETLQELEAHWRTLTEQRQEQGAAPQMGGMGLG